MKLHDLHESRARLVSEMRALTDTAEAETRDLNETEDGKFKSLKGELATLDRRIERATELAEAERRAPAIIHGENRGDGDFETRAREFSITKAIVAALPRDLGGGNVDAGFEKEISQEVARRSGRTFEGIAVPDQVFQVERRALGDNVMLTSGNAASLVPTNLLADRFIDKLRSSLVVGRLGAQILDGLVGDNDVPRQVGSATAEWVSEDSALSDTALNFDDVQLRPKTVGAITSYSRRTLLNSTPSIEAIVRNDLSRIIAGAIDSKALLGDGSSNTPTGVVHQTGAHNIPLMGGATWQGILSFPATIQHADADGAMAWVGNSWVVKKLRTTAHDPMHVDGEGYLMDSPNSLAGFPFATTSALPGDPDLANSPPVPTAATLIFGNWSNLMVGYWSGIDLLINPYETEAYKRGRVLVRAMRDCDVAVRHGESFAYATDMPVF